jgi:hypothetical protein
MQNAAQQLRQENEQLARHVQGLRSNPRVIEDEARKQGYVRPGERVFVLTPPSGDTALPPPAAGSPSDPSRSARREQPTPPAAKESWPVWLAAAMALGLFAAAGGIVLRHLRLRRKTNHDM